MKLIDIFAQAQRVTNCTTGQSDAFDPGKTPSCVTNLPQVSANTEQLKNGLGVAFGVAAGVALIALAIAAFNFATASSDSEKISRAKKAIVFALVGLILSLSAEVIVLTLIGKI